MTVQGLLLKMRRTIQSKNWNNLESSSKDRKSASLLTGKRLSLSLSLSQRAKPLRIRSFQTKTILKIRNNR